MDGERSWSRGQVWIPRSEELVRLRQKKEQAWEESWKIET
jgi:hypothetical protein